VNVGGADAASSLTPPLSSGVRAQGKNMHWLGKLVQHYREQDDLVDIFGLLLYTEEHANIKKVIVDDDYWASFHELSGRKWVVFSVRPLKGEYGFPEFPPGFYGMMCMIWKEPRENKELLEIFGLKDTKNLPLLVVFTHDAEGNILTNSIKLKDDSIDTAYNSIKESIKIVTDAVEGIDEKNRKNSEGVSNAINMAIFTHKQWQNFKRGLDFYQWVKGLKP
jgi:hypothetical protein